MKTSILTTSFIALVVSVFSLAAQAEEAAKASLSITPASAAQVKSMGSVGVKSQSTIYTTVTMGNKTVTSSKKPAHLKVNKKTKVLIKVIATSYKVQKGDSLYAIAQKNGTTIEHIMSINALKSTTILVGQMLKI
jgi:LysM repeat protein